MKFIKKKYLIIVFISIFICSCQKIDNHSKMLIDEKKIQFSSSPKIYPFEYYEKNKLIGFDIEIGKLIAKELGKESVFHDKEILASFQGLKNNHFDAIISTVVLSKERQREENFLISDSYFEDDMIILYRKNDKRIENLKIKDLKKLENLKMSCSYGCFIFDEWISENTPNFEYPYYNHLHVEIDALIKGKIDISLINKNEGLFLIQKYKNQLSYLDEIGLKVNYGILFNKDNLELKTKVNEIIKKLKKNGEIELLIKEWKL